MTEKTAFFFGEEVGVTAKIYIYFDHVTNKLAKCEPGVYLVHFH